MNNLASRWGVLGVGTKLTAGSVALVGAFLVALVLAFNVMVTQLFEKRATEQVVQQSQLVVDLIHTADRDLRARTTFLAQAFQGSLPAPFALSGQTTEVAGHATPELLGGTHPLNRDEALVDGFTRSTGAVATVFAKSGEDFVRVTTSLKNAAGERVVGTQLDRSHPGYAAVRQGQSYTGLATLFGRQYMTQYDPIRNAQGEVVGLSFVGLDFSDYMSNLKAAIARLKIGATGYFYVLDTRQGPSYGQLIIHPTLQGKSLLDQKDDNGRLFVRDMLAQKSGHLRYPWRNAALGETQAREKVVAFSHVEHWHWLIAGGAYVDEYAAEVTGLRWALVIAAAVFLLAVSVAVHTMVRRLITAPLGQARAAAEALAQGDLTASVQVRRDDEIGALGQAMNRIGSSLTKVVQAVRLNSDSVATSCVQIAQGNQDLSARTENQAGALEQTASSMTELGSTVRQNADNARQASRLAEEASSVATEGGQVVAQVVSTMKGIDESSKRIADIIAVIDGISFQTNILALNAAVEAARAGESGRGFAVVASEVRQLAGRSADAAREIRTLIHTSAERVEQGSQLVDQAGATMTRVVGSIQRVNALVSEICAASVEQHQGVEQVGAAVAQIDSATQQNAALVEQMAAAASSLEQQAQDLVQSVSVFQLEVAT